uniref:Tetratricopeptide repeat protein 37 n=1 Tax=Lygus hesperus TaxID=30085 RepID=A0A146KRS2_LYGHE
MEKSKMVNFNVSSPQHSMAIGEKIVSFSLDHLDEETDNTSLNLKELYERVGSKTTPGTKVSFVIKNEISMKERELFKFCKEQMKKKKFDLIVAHATELLKEHPSSAWAHFFFGVACKKIPSKENLFVPALTHAVSVNPNFLSGWQALHKHFQSLGGFFCAEAHDEMCIIVRVLLSLDPSYENWCGLVGQIWDYVIANDFNENHVLSLLSPFLNCDCPKRQETVAQVFINFIRYKKKLLSKTFSSEVLKSFQILITAKEPEVYRLGVLFAAVRYFNRSNDSKQICELLNFVHVNNVLKWNLTSAKEFAYNLIYEIFRTLGPDALETVLILKTACGEEMLNNNRYYLSDTILKLTSSYSNLLENYNTRRGSQLFWGRLLYLKVLTHLKLYQEAYEQVIVDLKFGSENSTVGKEYMVILIDILGHAKDPFLQRFALQLGYKYLKMYGLDVKVLHHICFINICLKDHVTAAEALKCLMSLGALDDVIYLQALREEDDDTKLDYLKALENVPDAHLLSATLYSSMGKSKRVAKSMLEASFHYHGGIAPFEWLGIHYYERDLVVKSIRYFLEAFSNFLVSCVSVNYIISIYSKHGDPSKLRAFFETMNGRSAITMDVACSANLKAGLNYLTKAKETYDFHRALEKFRKVTDFSFERKIIEMVADSQSYFGMHGSASDFYLMCHAENGRFHVYPAVLYGSEIKMFKRRGGYNYLKTLRNVAAKASQSPMALYTFGCAVFDRALASHSVNNYRHCIFLCQQAVLVLSRCIALYSEVASFWITLGNLMFTVSSVHASFGSVLVPSWLLSQNKETQSMVLVKKHEAYILALRCYSVALKICKSEDMRKLINFYIGLTFRYAKTFYKESGDRMLYWALSYALDSCDFQSWQRNNLCGVILTGLDQFKDALEFFKDAMLIGAKEDARDAEFNLGIVYLRLGEFIDAHEVFMYRRGGDPMDSLVWRSYMLLHQCLGDRDTVLHNLWFLIYSIKHYPSFEQGMDYLRLICDSVPVSDSDSSEHLKKKCLLYTIFRSLMFMKMTFVGDCEVPHKFNGVTALNYFYHGEYQSALGYHTAAEDNFHDFLKLIAEDGRHASLIDQSLFRLAMASEDNFSCLHSLLSTEKSHPDVAISKFYATCSSDDKNIAMSELLKDLESCKSETDTIFASLFGVMKDSEHTKLPPTTKKFYTEFLSRTLIRTLLGIPSTRGGFSHPHPNEEMLDQIIHSIFALFATDQNVSLFLSKKSIISILEKELSDFFMC